MARASKKPQLIEFKGTTLPIVSVTLRSLHPVDLARTATELFGDETFFDGDAAVLELDQIECTNETAVDWTAVRAVFDHHGLHVVGVRGAGEALRESAATAGLPSLAAFKRTARTTAEPAHAADVHTPQQPAEQPPAPTPVPQSVVQPTFNPTLIIDRPLRSGQQAYARGGDLVVLAAVNAGAEVIADGSIHIYAPLRGRALAGASGDSGARIFTTRFEAELVSIAGVYRTFEAGIPEPLAGKPVQVRLSDSDEGDRLSIAALKTD